MAATIRISWFGGNATEPTDGTSAESGFKFNKADSLSGTTPVVKPTATGTNFSWLKQFALEVTTQAATTIGTLQVKMAQALSTGLTIGFLGSGTYADPTSGGSISDSGSNGAVPSGYAAVTTSYQTYDSATGISTTGTAPFRVGNFCRIVAGVDNTYAGGAGSALSMVASGTQDILIQYTEV
jgi:hypothetical protein